MASLNKDWLTQKTLDFEYKKYLLLGYLQSVSKEFESLKLYPSLADLVEHYKNVVLIKENANQLQNLFQKRITQIDWENFKIIYQSELNKEGIIEDLEEIINFAIPLLKNQLDEGKSIYNQIEKHIHIEPLGVLPLTYNEGYMFLKEQPNPQTHVYQYSITIFDQPNERYKAINTTLVGTYSLSLSNTLESIKSDLIKQNRELPNPATFIIESENEIPLNETLLPLAKRILVKYTSSLEN